MIDQRAFDRNAAALDRAKATDSLTIAAGGTYDDSEGFFIDPTVLLGDDPTDEAFSTEYFGPILSLHVYDDVGARRVRRHRCRLVDQGRRTG